MSTLTRYLMGEIVRMSLMVLAALISLFVFFNMVSELGDLGQGHYTLWKMTLHVVLGAPSIAYDILPISALIGGILALSVLNQHSEFTVMRTGGLSIWQMIGILALTGVLFGLATLAIGELVAPNSERAAAQIKLAAKGQGILQDYRSGFWFKDRESFLNGEALPDETLKRLDVYQFDDARRLDSQVTAQHGVWQAARNAWMLSDVTTTRFTDTGVVIQHKATEYWRSVMNPDTMAGLLVQPDKLSIANLLEYIDYLKQSKQNTGRWEFALWGKLVYPFICVAMLIIALPFAQTQRRAGGAGIKLFTGITIGLAFYFVDQLVARWGLLYDWSPVLSNTAPSLALLAFAMFLLWRQERR